MGSIFTSIFGGGSEPTPPPVVQPAPVVPVAPVVRAGEGRAEKKEKKKRIRRGVRSRVPTTVMGAAPTETKTLLGQ